jgi:CRISPR-associated exonuclease Cas4
MEFEELPSGVHFTGTQVNYYVICHTKLWLFTHHISMESENENVQIGKYIHEKTYSREMKNVIIDEKIALDIIRKDEKLIICEVKKSMKLEKAHLYQLYYYIYYLKKIKGIENVEGLLLYPEQKTKKEVQLTEQIINEIEEILIGIKKIIGKIEIPKPLKKSYCTKCAYFEFCWV